MRIAYCLGDRGRDFAPAGDLLSGVPESKQRTQPDCLRPFATFHFATGKPASRNSDCGAAKLAACWRTPLKHVAASQITKHWHSSVPMPAARTACRRRSQTGGIGRPARVVAKLTSSLVIECGSSYQNCQRSYPAPSIAPCAHACDGKLLGLAVAPQSATASSSLLRQRV